MHVAELAPDIAGPRLEARGSALIKVFQGVWFVATSRLR
jgi:hypothetical protein